MRISEAATISGLSADTIRYYEKSGLVPAIKRGPDRLRRFSPENIEWLTLLYWLRKTGMPMKEMRRFAELYRQGASSIPERKAVLLRHEVRLRERRADLDQCSKVLAYKIETYKKIEGDLS
ncbi:MerR family transcriptional regulator [Roseibium album]|uniref:HTH-type transcriptional regulator AdhR n=1 Tax=Roseibium album TaxID=311410 RepID=A0A0M7ATN6_9HYPH|nr:MerR family transcriptional regulator [Roseibium album]CTQ62102.1 HTH-type transcriptional regulator AdhR [Roseibium album]CTQ78505.1 HTH-type transcriptional regulator AdhR [Roseibium album]CTQ79867.1 HTH-type transcriptional regulator AdhR [Roseibium album]